MNQPEKIVIERDPVTEVYKRHVNREAIRENLKLTVTERLQKAMDRLREAEAIAHATGITLEEYLEQRGD